MKGDQPDFGFVRPMMGAKTFQLNKEELERFLHYEKHGNFTGGYQSLIKELYSRLKPDTGEIELDDALVGKIVRYATAYGHGGFQDSFLRPVFRRILNL